MARTPYSLSKNPGSIPGQETRVPQAIQAKNKIKFEEMKTQRHTVSLKVPELGELIHWCCRPGLLSRVLSQVHFLKEDLRKFQCVQRPIVHIGEPRSRGRR